MELKELKCTSCGAKLEVEATAEKVTCDYCHTSFAVKDAYNDGYNYEKGRLKAYEEQLGKGMNSVANFFENNQLIKKIGKGYLAVVIGSMVFALLVFLVIIFSIFRTSSNMNTSSFNSKFEIHVGTNFGRLAGSVLDDVIISNKKNKNHQITVVYGDISTTDPKKIAEIKHSFSSFNQYDISFDYDKKGYINKLTIYDL